MGAARVMFILRLPSTTRLRPATAVAGLLCAAAAALPCLGQAPRIGVIDFYGLNKVSVEKVRAALGVKEGDPLPASKADVEERIEAVGGIVRASLEATCCEDGKAILYVGVEERGAPHFDYLDEPAGNAGLPAEIALAYGGFLEAVEHAARTGTAGEDLSRGHSLMADETARAFQLRFVELAEKHLDALRKALRESADAEHRAIAAYVIGYAPQKRLVVNDLQQAIRDPDPTVRSNAQRALGAIAVLGQSDPELGIRVEPTWFVEMLYSLSWTDRNNAAVALVNFTEKRDPRILAHLRERALPALAQMSRWKHLPHALPSFILLGRMAGLPEEEIQDAWRKGEREPVIGRALRGSAKP